MASILFLYILAIALSPFPFFDIIYCVIMVVVDDDDVFFVGLFSCWFEYGCNVVDFIVVFVDFVADFVVVVVVDFIGVMVEFVAVGVVS